MKFKSIKTELTSYFLLFFIIISSTFSFITYSMTKSMLERNSLNLMLEISRQTVQNIENSLYSNINSLETLANIPQIKDDTISFEDKKYILEEEIKLHKHIKMGMVSKDGISTQTDGTIIDIKNRDYFKKAMEGTSIISEPIISNLDGCLVVVYIVPIKEGNNVKGALTAVRQGTDISSFSNNIKVGETGGTYILNSKGTTIAHKNNEIVSNQENTIELSKQDPTLKELANIEQSMISGSEGTGEYIFNGVEKLISYSSIKSTGWSVGIYCDKNEILKETYTLTRNIIILSLLFIIIAFICIWFISYGIAKKIISMKNHLNVFATGDLTKDLDNNLKKQKDELGDMGHSLLKAGASIADMIKNIKENTFAIDEEATSLVAISEEFTASSQNISTAINEVSNGAQDQANSIMEVVSLLNDFGKTINSTITDINDINIMAKEIDTKASLSNKDMENLLISIKSVVNLFKDFSVKISTMDLNVQKVNNITNLINSISEQTNLLALNAAIEAARAGESGRGFAVVAEEIRKLADISKKSSEDISSIINEVLKDTKNMVSSAEEVNINLKDQKTISDAAVTSFKEISYSVSNIIPKIGNIHNSSTIIDESKTIILDKSQSIAAIAEEISASSEEISASTQQMNLSSEETSNTAQDLSSMVKAILNKIEEFKI